MIAKLFSEPLPAQKLHSWIETALLFFFSPLFVVLTISAVFVLQIEQTCEGLWLRCCFYSPLCCSVPPPPTPLSSFTSTPSIYFVWFNKPYSPDVRQSRSGVSWGRPFLKICVLCLDSLKLQHLLHPETTVVVFLKKRKTLKLNIERRSVYLQLHLDFYCYLVQRANCCHPPGSAPLSKACSRSLISRRTSDRRPT